MSKIRTLYAAYGYDGDVGQRPAFVNLYRDRAATRCVASIPVEAPNAPNRRNRTVNLQHPHRHDKVVTTSFALEWID